MGHVRQYGIYYNPSAGHGLAEKNVKIVQEQLSEHDIQPILMTALSTEEAITLVANRLSGLDALIVVGGDGTLNVAVTAMIRRKLTVPLGLIPCGRVNNFAKRWRIPTDVHEALQIIFDRHFHRVGIGNCDDQRAIVSYLDFGNLADLAGDVREQQQHHDRWGKRLTYFLTALRRAGRHKSRLVSYQMDAKQPETYKTWFALLSTTAPNDSGDNPLRFHLSILKDIHRRQVIPYIYFAWSGHMHQSDAITSLTPRKLTLQAMADEKVVTRIDGDTGPYLPAKITYCPNVLPVFMQHLVTPEP